MTKYLHITGSFPVPTEDTAVLNALYALVVKHTVPVQLVAGQHGGLHMEVIPERLQPHEDDDFLEFLADVGKELPGKIVGELEVWWPMVVDSGPQWWTLDEAGKLFVTEGEIIRGEPEPYEG